MSKREEGYYWIRHDNDGGEWDAAMYAEDGRWYLTGSEIGFSENQKSVFPIVIHSVVRIHPPAS